MDPTLDVEAIRTLLPHRFPMLLVDRILELQPGKHVIGLKNVSINEPYFTGHFPGQAVMPGVLIIEVMAQVAALMLLAQPRQEGKIAYLAEVEGVKFRRPVIPGDTIIAEASVKWMRGPFGMVKMKCRVDGAIVAEGELKFKLQSTVTQEELHEKIEHIRQSSNGKGRNSATGGQRDARSTHRDEQDSAEAQGSDGHGGHA
ncbi:MAG TPA: 3-hydroxyacyl-ACP dehydratase FabZ [Chthonomonadaceae bacterium]|nr:3-hydroxyacyl-ACP dehydratase FabZ [Chthonomonadaceae bacterium]